MLVGKRAVLAGRRMLNRMPRGLIDVAPPIGASPWTNVNVTVTANAIQPPLSSMVAYKVEATTTGPTRANLTMTGAGRDNGITVEWFAKQGSAPADCNSFAVFLGSLLFNMSLNYSTGATSMSAGSGGYAVALENGWWRVLAPIKTGITEGSSPVIYAGFPGNSETIGKFAYITAPRILAGLLLP